MEERMINWGMNKEENKIALEIALRAIKNDPELNLLNTLMDIEATHLNGNPLRLKDLFEADNFNFMHDIIGIHNHIDRESGKLTRGFSPRFSA